MLTPGHLQTPVFARAQVCGAGLSPTEAFSFSHLLRTAPQPSPKGSPLLFGQAEPPGFLGPPLAHPSSLGLPGKPFPGTFQKGSCTMVCATK